MRFIQLSQNKETAVDDEDFEWLSQWKWYYSSAESGLEYAQRHLEKPIKLSLCTD
jgi:hypothetical protein